MGSDNVKISIIVDGAKQVVVSTKLSIEGGVPYYLIDNDSFLLIPDNIKSRIIYSGEFFYAVKDFKEKVERSFSAIVPNDKGWAIRDAGGITLTAKQ